MSQQTQLFGLIKPLLQPIREGVIITDRSGSILTAQILGVDRSTLWRRMQRLGMD